jgi:hypothetical protein
VEDSSILIFDAIGLAGVAFYITAYAALQGGLIRGNGYTYTCMNLIAAALVLVSLTNNFNLSSAIIQMTWIAISVFGLARYFILHHSIKLTAEEAAFVRSKLPTISKPLARRFFQAGTWEDIQAGTVIATEDKPLRALVYLLLGEAKVTLGGKSVGQIRADDFIGEMTCLNGGLATATVTATGPSRIFRISSKALIRLCNRNPELTVAIEQAARKDIGLTLVAANTLMTGPSSSAQA